MPPPLAELTAPISHDPSEPPLPAAQSALIGRPHAVWISVVDAHTGGAAGGAGGGVFALIAYRFQFGFSGPPLPSPLQQRQPQLGLVP